MGRQRDSAFWKVGRRLLLIVLLTLAVSGPARAGHIVSGMIQSSTSFEGDLFSPSLAGQRADYIVVQLKAFRKKTRTDPVMNKVASDMTDAEIDNLAAISPA